jgi:hypothetical protein
MCDRRFREQSSKRNRSHEREGRNDQVRFRGLIQRIILSACLLGSLSGCTYEIEGTPAYFVTPISCWNLAAGVLGSSVLVTSSSAIIVTIAGLLITGGTIVGGVITPTRYCRDDLRTACAPIIRAWSARRQDFSM